MRKRIYLCFLLLLSLAGLVSCGKKTLVPDEVLTQKVSSKDKIQVTVLVKYAFTIDIFEKAVEEKFTNLDLVQVGNYTSNMGTAEYEARMKHDDLTDLVMTWPLNIGEEYWEERLLDLSSLPISGNYNTSMLNQISRDGKLYYLPGPSQVRGILYNKTMFAENGWEVPNDFDGFIRLCKDIEETGIRALQLGLGNAEVLDTAFVGYGLASSFSKPGDAKWLEDYNQGKGNFIDHFEPALDTFQTLIDEGILRKGDLNLYYQDRERMFFARECAMVEDSVLMARMGYDVTGSTDEFGLMPFLNDGVNGDWARLYPVCFIGLNKHLEEPQNKAKYDLVMQLLEYISTPEGQLALGGDTGAMFSSLTKMPPPDVPEIEDLVSTLMAGRYAVFPTLENAQGALRRGLAGMVEGTMTKEDVAGMVDAENLSPPVKTPPKVLGTASEDFSMIDTGNFITDTMREQCSSDIALFLDNGKDGTYTGKGICSRIYQGEQTNVDVMRIFPDLKHGEIGELWNVTMTGEHLLHTLEYSIPVDNNSSGWFYYFSGLQMEYAPAAEPGKRIRSIKDAEGKEIDPEKVYSIAVMDDTVPEEFLLSCEKTGILIKDMLEQVIEESGTISPAKDGRFKVSEP